MRKLLINLWPVWGSQLRDALLRNEQLQVAKWEAERIWCFFGGRVCVDTAGDIRLRSGLGIQSSALVGGALAPLVAARMQVIDPSPS